MDLSKIKEGMEVETYKVLCKLLDEREKSGNSKKAQLKKWKTFFKWRNVGRKFIIDKIYSIPINKIDMRGRSEGSLLSNRAKYVENIEVLLLDLLSQADCNTQEGLLISKATLLRAFNMINDNYYKYKDNQVELKETLNIRKETIEDFYDTTSSMLQNNIESALKNLRRRSLVSWGKKVAVNRVMSKESEHEVLKISMATPQEEVAILDIELEILEMFAEKYEIDINCARWQDLVKKLLFINNEYEVYDNMVKTNIRERLNIISYFNAYHINFDLKVISNAKQQYLLSMKKRKNSQSQINKGIRKRISDNAEKRTEKAKSENKIETKYRKTKKYKQDINKMSKTLINEKTKEI